MSLNLKTSSQKLGRWLAGSVTLTAIALSALPAQTATLPTNPLLKFQTSGARRCANVGDWYTTAGARNPADPNQTPPDPNCGPFSTPPGATTTNPVANQLHRFRISITAADIAAAGGSASVTVRDARVSTATDEVTGNPDPTRFTLSGPGYPVQSQTVLPTAPGADITFSGITAPGIYELTSETGADRIQSNPDPDLNNDDNSFSIDVPGNDVLIGQFQGTIQQDSGTPQTIPFYFLVGPGTSSLALRNFDLDNNGVISYTNPSGGAIPGTASGNAVWNNGGNLNTGQDTVALNPVITNATINDFGRWQLTLSNYTSGNQTLLEANSDLGRLPLFDPAPTTAGNFTITPNGDLTTSIGVAVDHPFTVTNNFLTTDIINLALTGTNPTYTVQLLDSNGAALTDSDADGVLDTGILQPGASRNFILRVTPNAGTTTIDTTVISGTSFMERKVRQQANNGAPVPQTVTKITRISNGSIGDLVFTDTNGNGVFDSGESGIGGVTVTLTQPGPDGTIGTGDDVTTTTTTSTVAGTVGQYSFSGLALGPYRVTVTPPAGLTATTPASLDRTLSATTPAVTDADFGFRGNLSIGDLVFNDVNGNGAQDPGDTGVSGIVVTLTGPTGTVTTTTDANGAYSFPGLSPGTYTVSIPSPNPLPGLTLTTSATFTRTLTNAPINDVDFGVRGQGLIGDTVFADLNNNGVQNPGEPGVPNVTVRLINPGPDGTFGNADDQTVQTTQTNGNGNYSFTPVSAGNYRVAIDLPTGFTATTPTNIDRVLSNQQIDNNRDFGVRGPGSIGNVVFTDANGNGVQDPDEPGVANVTVNLATPGPDGVFGTADDVVFTTTTDANGNYRITGLPLINYQVTVQPPAGSGLTTPRTIPVALTAANSAGVANFGLRSPGTGRLNLLKQITNITRNGVTIPGFNFDQALAFPAIFDPNIPNWTQVQPRGLSTVNGRSQIRSGDVITYTVYYLSDGLGTAFDANVCDQIPDRTTFIPGSTQIQRNATSPVPGGTAFTPLAPLPAGNGCRNQSNPNGSVLFNLGDVPNTPGNNFGFVRFQVRIN